MDEDFSIDEQPQLITRARPKRSRHILMRLGLVSELKHANILSLIIAIICICISVWLLLGVFGSEYDSSIDDGFDQEFAS